MAEFEFSIHEKTKQISVKVLNKETKEVIQYLRASIRFGSSSLGDGRYNSG